MSATRRLLLPHVAIVAAYLGWRVGLLPEPVMLTILVAAHLALPVWCVIAAPASPLLRVFLIGPGTLIATYLGLIAWAMAGLRDGPGEDTWIAWMALLLALAAVGGYLVYCLLVFGITAARRRRKRRS